MDMAIIVYLQILTSYGGDTLARSAVWIISFVFATT